MRERERERERDGERERALLSIHIRFNDPEVNLLQQYTCITYNLPVTIQCVLNSQ